MEGRAFFLKFRVVAALTVLTVFSASIGYSAGNGEVPASKKLTSCLSALLGNLLNRESRGPTGKLQYLRDEGRSGRWFVDEAGVRWYAKPDEVFPELQTSAEVISSEIYQHFGYEAPEVVIRTIDGRRQALIQEIGQGGHLDSTLSNVDTPEFRQMRVVSAYLKDWDRLRSSGRNNFDFGNGRFAVYDFGGTLGARTRGQHKPGNVFSRATGTFEPTTNFGDIYDTFDVSWLPDNHAWKKLTREDALAVTEKFKTLTDERIRAIVAEARYTDPQDAEYIIQALQKRRDGIIEGLAARFPETPKTPVRVASVPKAGAPVVLREGRAPKFVPGHTYDAKTIEERVFAVHATEFFPEDGVIRTGASDVSGSKASIAEEPPSFRPTTHWSLGELVREHRVSWEDQPYAVILPVGSLKKQLINVNTYDTFTLGDFRLPEGTIIVVPKGFSKRIPPGVKVETYERGTTLRAAVDHTIEKYGGWHIEMKAGRRPSLDSVGEIDGHSVNTAEFFDPILKGNPQISFGSHIHSQVGTAYRMGNIEQAIYILMKQYGRYSRTQSTEEVIFLRKFIDHHLTRLDQEIRSARFPESSVATYNEKVGKLREWLNILDTDLELRRQYGVTIAGLDEQVANKIRSLRGNPQALRNYVFNQLEPQRLNRQVPSELMSPSAAAEYLAGAPLSEAKELTKVISDQRLMSASDLQTTYALYSLKRALTIDLTQARSEGLLEVMESSFRAVGSKDKVVESAMDTLAEFLDTTSTRLPSALKILESPGIKEALEAHYGIRIPSSGLTLEGLLRIHPQTKVVFETATASGGTTSHTILEKLGVLGRKSSRSGRDPALSFNSAKRQARVIGWSKKSLAGDLKQVQRPMSTTRDESQLRAGDTLTLYEQMKRGDYGTVDQIWQTLGLHSEFRQLFPRDADFWRSSQSFEEIYLRLTHKH